jgi:hypothetical protein
MSMSPRVLYHRGHGRVFTFFHDFSAGQRRSSLLDRRKIKLVVGRSSADIRFPFHVIFAFCFLSLLLFSTRSQVLVSYQKPQDLRAAIPSLGECSTVDYEQDLVG